MQADEFLERVKAEGQMRNLDEARLATKIVFSLLHNQVSPEEVDDVADELPDRLAQIWCGGETWYERVFSRFTPQRRFNRTEFIREVNARKQNIQATGEDLTRAVFYAMQSQLSGDEITDISAQLPTDLRELWEEARPLTRYKGGGVTAEEDPSRIGHVGSHIVRGDIPDTLQ